MTVEWESIAVIGSGAATGGGGGGAKRSALPSTETGTSGFRPLAKGRSGSVTSLRSLRVGDGGDDSLLWRESETAEAQRIAAELAASGV